MTKYYCQYPGEAAAPVRARAPAEDSERAPDVVVDKVNGRSLRFLISRGTRSGNGPGCSAGEGNTAPEVNASAGRNAAAGSLQ